MNEFKVTELQLGSGITAYIKPLSPLIFEKLRAKAEALYPLPDAKAYETEPEPGLLAIPGEKIPASQNPAYREAVSVVEGQRREWLLEAVIRHACEFRESREALIEQFAGSLAALREDIELPGDEWLATLHLIITSEVEKQVIIAAAESRLALTEGEIVEGRNLFRLLVPLEKYGRAAILASGVQGRVRGQP